MTMLERVARAAAPHAWDGWIPLLTRWARAEAVRTVERALRAIREPDERVIEAMRAQLAERDACSSVTEDGLICGAACWCQITALAVWQEGIDAMMEEGK